MIFSTEHELVTYAENLGKTLSLPAVFELIGDVGAGKTTFARGLANGLGVKTPITSPSFSISNRYIFPLKTQPDKTGLLIHYDFYRLDDPGLMQFELEEALSLPNSVVLIEWGASVKKLLPASSKTITFRILPNDARQVEIS